MRNDREFFKQRAKQKFQEFTAEHDCLIVYLRERGRHLGPRKAILLAYMDNGLLFVGWSQCHNRDQFDRHIGLWRAIQKSRLAGTWLQPTEECERVPHDVRHALPAFLLRVKEWRKRKEERRHTAVSSVS